MRRHDLVYLHPQATFETSCVTPESPCRAVVSQWIAAGRPLVAARQTTSGGSIRLGLTLPLRHDRKRLAIDVERKQIAAIRPPLALRQCLARLPAGSERLVRALDREVGACGARLGVFGSLAWETLSGEAYRHPESDIDVVCDITGRRQYAEVLAAMTRTSARLPCRLDGELRFPGGYAVAWRELSGIDAACDRSVLAKGEYDTALLPLANLLKELAPAALAA